MNNDFIYYIRDEEGVMHGPFRTASSAETYASKSNLKNWELITWSVD